MSNNLSFLINTSVFNTLETSSDVQCLIHWSMHNTRLTSLACILSRSRPRKILLRNRQAKCRAHPNGFLLGSLETFPLSLRSITHRQITTPILRKQLSYGDPFQGSSLDRRSSSIAKVRQYPLETWPFLRSTNGLSPFREVCPSLFRRFNKLISTW